MSRMKTLLTLTLGLALLLGKVGVVNAAPLLQEDVPVTGTIQSVVVETDSDSGVQTVLVTALVNGVEHTARLDLETAVSLGLITIGEGGEPAVDESRIGTEVQIDPTLFDSDAPPVDEKQHPVGSKLAEFFSSLANVDYEMIMSSHADGFGFGVITQALWMTKSLGGDATLFAAILDAKESGDYSMVVLPEGAIPQNWGQFKKAVLSGEDDDSLGDVMSGNDEGDNPGNGNGKPDDPGNGNGKPEDPGNGNGKSEDPGNGNGKPDDPGNGNKPDNPGNSNPPGQNKDKNKDKQNNRNDKK